MVKVADAGEVARMFKVLSVEARVRIIQLLRDRALCVGALAARLDVTQGAVSQHLRILRDAGLVEAEKRGYFVHYEVNRRALEEWEQAAAGLLGSERKKEGDVSCVMKRKRSAARSRKT